MAGEGSKRERGASPPLKIFLPLEQNKIRVLIIRLFERGNKG